VEINCHRCGTENWLENQSRCLACDSILRRCIDCSGYDAGRETCRAIETDVDRYEAENPSLLSMSTNCLRYQATAAARSGGPG
jgi:hypothetical protein